MYLRLKPFAFLLILFSSNLLFSQNVREVAVEIQASLDKNNDLVLNWKQQSGSTRYQVYEKTSDDKSWNRIADLSGSDTVYTDTSYVLGTKKEYKVARTSSNWSGWDGNGYIIAGFDIAPKENLGVVLMIIEDKYQSTASNEVLTYISQIQNEGFTVDTHFVSSSDKPDSVKTWIETKFNKLGSSINSIFLFGRVPVPYSGDAAPDGHSEHKGAWPADLYYGSFSLKWTDNTVSRQTASRKENWNVPNDGKFDMYRYNSSSKSSIDYVEIPVGRVDLTNMPSFGDDTALIKRYLKKALAFRTGEKKFTNRALVDDNFGFFGGEAFASGGFRNFAPFVGNNISTSDYRSEMGKNDYLWSYGCGGGTYSSASGVSSTSNFTQDSLQNPFTLNFGSYFGDWDNKDNYLRAPLASKGWGLTNAWAGRPYWMVHSMAMGEPFSKAVMHTYNTWGIYNAAAYMSGTHVALMGDPTLRAYVVDNIHQLSYKRGCGDVKLNLGEYSDYADSIVVEYWSETNQSWSNRKAFSNTDTVVSLSLQRGEQVLSVRYLKLLSSASGTWWQYGARDTIHVIVDTIPNIGLKYLGMDPFCLNQDYLSVDYGNYDSTVMSKYLWRGKEISTAYLDTFKFSFNQSGFDTLILHRVSQINGCEYADTAIMEALDVKVDPYLPGKFDYCLGDTITIRDNDNIDSRIMSRWGYNGFVFTIGMSDSIKITSDTAQNIEFVYERESSQNGCYYSDTVSFKFVEVDKPEIVVDQNMGRIGDTIKLSTSTNYSNYYWNGMSSTSSNYEFVADDTVRTIVLFVEDANGCRSEEVSKSFNFIVNSYNELLPENWSVFPNPTKGMINLKTASVTNIEASIMNSSGQVVRSFENIHGQEFNFDLTGLSNGIYFLNVVSSDGASANVKIIKE